MVCPPGEKNFSPPGEGGGGQTILHTGGGDKHFYTERGGVHTFYVKDVGGDDDVNGEDMSEANFLVSEARKLSAGTRIFRGP